MTSPMQLVEQARARLVPSPAESAKPFVFPPCEMAQRWCHGVGIEIGPSAHNQLVPGAITVDRTDEVTVFKQKEIEMCGRALAVDVVADADALPFADGSLDYVASSHVFEHLVDPVKALLEWDRVLRVGGIMFTIVPHRDAEPGDVGRPLTTVRHFVDEWYYRDAKTHGQANGHEHVFSLATFLELEAFVVWRGAKWRVVDTAERETQAGRPQNGFVVVIEKIGERAR